MNKIIIIILFVITLQLNAIWWITVEESESFIELSESDKQIVRLRYWNDEVLTSFEYGDKLHLGAIKTIWEGIYGTKFNEKYTPVSEDIQRKGAVKSYEEYLTKRVIKLHNYKYEIDYKNGRYIEESTWIGRPFSEIATLSGVLVTQDYYILEIEGKFDEVTVDKFKKIEIIPILSRGLYNNGSNHFHQTEEVILIIPRNYDEIKFWGLNDKFGYDYTLNLKPYGDYVMMREERIELTDVEKPLIKIEYPHLENGIFRTEELFLTIEGRVEDESGILSVSINDEKVSLKQDKFKKRVRLNIGRNDFIITTTDIFDNEAQEQIIVVRDEIIIEEEFSDVDYIEKTGITNENAIAVIFGIEKYRTAPAVKYAVNDADIFREYLIKKFGLLRENIYMRLDEQATKGEFEKAFSETGWIAKHSNDNTEIYIYYAGHGIAESKTCKAYLIPHDIDPNYASTGYSIDELYDNINAIEAKSKTIILDACFTGISGEEEMLLADARPIRIEVKNINVPLDIDVFTASSNNEISSSYSGKQHGLFTYYFLKGLNKEADKNKDRIITLGEMEQYLIDNVSSQARKMDRIQNPQLQSTNKDRLLIKY
ncbi:MAG: caspase family protein [Candidatus Stygibacter australis]|nr:caspase family protein [Candidatus Stygibacter australis]